MAPSPSSAHNVRAALYLVLVGVCAALHVWKLPPALPALQDEFGLSLVESGFLLSIVQLAGVLLGLIVGLVAERIGLRRCIIAGLALLGAASAFSIRVDSLGMMLMLRGVEGCGFLMVAMPIPSLLRRLVPPTLLSRIMGLWSCYIPIGTILILVFGSWMLSVSDWRTLWLVLAAITAGFVVLTWLTIPPDTNAGPAPPSSTSTSAISASTARHSTRGSTLAIPRPSAITLVRQTLATHSSWLVAATFGMYSAQWMAVVGFLPTVYAAAGLTGPTAGLLTGLVAGANIVGNLLAGQLLHRKIAARRLLIAGFSTMIVCAYLAFGAGLPPAGQFVSVVTLSAVGGLIPATMFVLAVTVAPAPHTTTTTVGWMQQGSSLGQFCGPPIIGWMVGLLGGWQYTWLGTGAFAAAGILFAMILGAQLEKRSLAETVAAR